MYTIKRAAELTGVSEATLRAWERRYGLVAPHRTESGYRVYSEDDLSRIREVVALVEQGSTPGLAARLVRTGSPTHGGGEGGATPVLLPPAPDGPPLVAQDRGGDATARLIAAASDIDPAAVGAVLDEQFATGSFEHVVDGWLMPALVAVGNAWAGGGMSIAGEHLVAHAVHRRIAAAFDAARVAGGTHSVVVGLPAGVHHELGLFAFSVALRRAGLDVLHLGPDVPIDAWRAALTTHGAKAAVTAAPMTDDVAAARAIIRGLRRSDPDTTLVVGGGQQDAVEGAHLVRPGHLIGPGAVTVAAAVAPALR